MRVREFGEDALIAAFAQIYQARAGVGPESQEESEAEVQVGIGDDGAVLLNHGARQVVTTDIATEGVHFNRTWSSAQDIGAKIAIANLADLFAMGATPHYLTVAIATSGDEEVSYLLDLARGIESVAQAHHASIVGGDVVAGKSLTIAITALGSVERPVLRSGARPGDHLFLTRMTGRSLAGLLLLSGGLADAQSEQVRFFQRPDFHPEDLLECGFDNMTALMDISDGLLADLPKLAKSSAVGIDLDIKDENMKELREFSEKLGRSTLELFLRSGEEHSFVVVVPEANLEKVPARWIRIGRIVEGNRITLGGVGLEMAERSWHWEK